MSWLLRLAGSLSHRHSVWESYHRTFLHVTKASRELSVRNRKVCIQDMSRRFWIESVTYPVLSHGPLKRPSGLRRLVSVFHFRQDSRGRINEIYKIDKNPNHPLNADPTQEGLPVKTQKRNHVCTVTEVTSIAINSKRILCRKFVATIRRCLCPHRHQAVAQLT